MAVFLTNQKPKQSDFTDARLIKHKKGPQEERTGGGNWIFKVEREERGGNIPTQYSIQGTRRSADELENCHRRGGRKKTPMRETG